LYRTNELSTSFAKQKQYDMKISDLTSTVTRLQSSLHNSKVSESEDYGKSIEKAKSSEFERQISVLSEELFRQRIKHEDSSSEILTLRSRLKAALIRAENAEKSTISATQFGSHDIESVNSYGQSVPRRRKRKETVPSIRTAIKFDPGRGEIREQIGSIIDVLDKAAIYVGSHFRHNPITRAFFLIYLIIIHMWTFLLFTFHAHTGLESGRVSDTNHGPEQLMKNVFSYRENEQLMHHP